MTEQSAESAKEDAQQHLIDANAAAFIATIMLKSTDGATMSTQPDLMRLNSGHISFLDRIVVLAGGALALLFTVIANLGSRLHESRLDAHHPAFITISCWCFVLCILTGCFAGWSALKLQGQETRRFAISQVDSRIKLGILEKYPQADVSKISSISETLFDAASHKRWGLLASGLVIVTYSSLVAAFAFLALFVQSNVPLLLTGR